MMFLHLEKGNTLNEFQVMGRLEGGLGYKEPGSQGTAGVALIRLS